MMREFLKEDKNFELIQKLQRNQAGKVVPYASWSYPSFGEIDLCREIYYRIRKEIRRVPNPNIKRLSKTVRQLNFSFEMKEMIIDISCTLYYDLVELKKVKWNYFQPYINIKNNTLFLNMLLNEHDLLLNFNVSNWEEGCYQYMFLKDKIEIEKEINKYIESLNENFDNKEYLISRIKGYLDGKRDKPRWKDVTYTNGKIEIEWNEPRKEDYYHCHINFRRFPPLRTTDI